jgi:hypothetical protein
LASVRPGFYPLYPPVFVNAAPRQLCHYLNPVLLVRIPFVVRRFPTHRIVHDTHSDCSFIEKGTGPSDLEGKSLIGT